MPAPSIPPFAVPPRTDDPHGPPDETEHRTHRDGLSTDRLDRTYAEILQGWRPPQTGAQISLALALALASPPKSHDLALSQLRLYIATLVLGAMSASLLMAPAAFNRLVSRQTPRRRLVTAVNRF